MYLRSFVINIIVAGVVLAFSTAGLAQTSASPAAIPSANQAMLQKAALNTSPAAQPSSPAGTASASPADIPKIVKTVNEVNVIFSAVDKHHRLVTGLQPNDVAVYDRHQLQRISRFLNEGNLPLRIALLIDVSSSVRDRFKFEQEAAIEFFDSVVKAGRDEALLVSFDTAPQLVQDFTDNQEELARAIRSLRAGGGTAIFDAVYYTAHDKLLQGGDNVRKVMVVISDGADNQSRVSREEALEMAQRAGAVIYTIGTEPTGADPESDKVLQRFAEQTGGRVFFPFQATDLGRSFQEIATELRHQYVLTYRPTNFVANGEYHPIDLRIARKGVIARARKGYYAIATR
jgi:VWFA-related protein